MIQLTEQEHLDQSVRLLLMSPQTRREDLTVVEHEQVALVKIVHQIRQGLVLDLPRFAMEHHHTRFVAVGCGELGYQMLRQLESELAEPHIIGFIHSL